MRLRLKVHLLLAGLCWVVQVADAQPVIITQPAAQTAAPGAPAIFSVGVSGPGPFTYQWRFNGTNLPNNRIITAAGNGAAAFSGDGGPATNASLNAPQGIAFDTNGNLFITDNNNDRVRKVDTNGIITTVAGNGVGAPGTGSGSYTGNGGVATNAGLNHPNNLAFDAAGNMYIADFYNHCIRKVDTNQIITTVAGNGGPGDYGDGGAATNAGLDYPTSLAFDGSGNLLVVELDSGRSRKVDTNGVISTVISNLTSPQGITVDATGNIYFAENLGRARVDKLATDGTFTTFAGGGSRFFLSGSSVATNAQLLAPWGMAFDRGGAMYIADKSFNTVYKVDTNGIMTIVAGSPANPGSLGDGGAAANAGLNAPACVAFDPAGNLFIADWNDNRVREVLLAGSPTLAVNALGQTNAGNYSVVVTSSSGSVTSSVAALQVWIPPVTPTLSTDGTVLSFTWNAISNRYYQLQGTTNLPATSWNNLGAQVMATGSVMTVSSPTGSNRQQFYRVQFIR